MEDTSCLVCASRDSFPEVETATQMLSPSAERFGFRRCRECDLVYLSPRVRPESLAAYYPPYYLPYRGPEAWGRFAPIAEWGLAITDRKRARLALRALERTGAELGTPATRVLDVGCGKPSFLRALKAAEPQLEPTGIDFVSSGWDGTPELWEELELVEGEPASYEPAPGAEPHLITMWHYLEHDYAPRSTLARLATIARGNTRLIIEVPDYNSLSRRLYGEHWQGFHTPRHTAIYTKKTLYRLLERSGWEPVGYSTAGTVDLYALWWMSAMERSGIDWSESLESRFAVFVLGRVLTAPLLPLAHLVPLGVQTVTARRKNE